MDLSQSPLRPLLVTCSSKDYETGNIVLYQGEVPRNAFYIKSGNIKVYNITDKGDEQVITLQTEGEIFPSPWIFGKATSSLHYYEPLNNCKLVSVPRGELVDFIYKNPQATQAMLTYYISAYTGALIRINALEQPKASEKILYTLFYLANRYGRPINNGKIDINLELTHQQLASLVGLTRETTALEMNKLKKRGIVTYSQKRYAVDNSKLQATIGEESFETLTI